MKKSLFAAVMTIIILIITKNLSAQDDTKYKKYKPKRYFYDFTKKKLQDSETSAIEIIPPLRFRSGRDLRIDFFDFNPLKMQISVSDSSSSWFLADTASFSRYIILPKVPDLAAGNKTEDNLIAADHTNSLKKSDFAADIYKAKILIDAVPRSTDCDKLTALMSSLNKQKQKIYDAILNYKSFCESIEIINDSYSRLQILYSLSSTAVKTELTQFFLPQLNSFLTSQGQTALNTDANLVSPRQMEEKEQIFYQLIFDESAKLADIQKKSDLLTGTDCGAAAFTPLLKSFTSNLQEIQDSVQSFKNSHTQLVHHAFMKTMGIYANIKLYMGQEPFFVTNALTITSDYNVISVYKKEAADPDRVLYDEIHVVPVRGWKLDIAGGFFFTGLADNLYTRNSQDSIYATKYVADGLPRYDGTAHFHFDFQTETGACRFRWDGLFACAYAKCRHGELRRLARIRCLV